MSNRPHKEGDRPLYVNVIDILPMVDEGTTTNEKETKDNKNDTGYLSDSSGEHVKLEHDGDHKQDSTPNYGSSILDFDPPCGQRKQDTVGAGCGESYQACILSFAMGFLFIICMILFQENMTIEPDRRMYRVNISYCEHLNRCSNKGVCLHNRYIKTDRCSCDYYIYAGTTCSDINWFGIAFFGLASFFIGSAIVLIFCYCINACPKRGRKHHQRLETLL